MEKQAGFIPNRYRVEGNIAYITVAGRDRRIVPLTTVLPERPSETIIDTADLERVISAGRWRLKLRQRGYRVIGTNVGGLAVAQMSRFIAQPPAGRQVEHINGNCLDNRRENLQIVTPRSGDWGDPGDQPM